MEPPASLDGRRGRIARVALAALVWLVLVALAGTLVWTVVSRAGRAVNAPTGALGAPTTSTPVSRPTGRPTGSPAPMSPTREAGRPGVERRTWSGSAGTVVAECRGARITLVQAVPSADGYAAEVKDDGGTGGGEVEVEFEGQVEDSAAETTVVGRCRDGVPVFVTEVER